MRRSLIAILLLAAVLAWLLGQFATELPGPGAGLPPEARATLALIERGGPFPHRQDGTTFYNRERLLPPRPNGYYREYTVRTPGAGDRGARRIVTGGHPPEVYYYTEDHYRSFRRIEPAR
jgi:ribonuclease T1